MPTYNGNDQNNTINGSRRGDVINGLGGNDVLNGHDGDDVIYGGAGNDYLAGGNGEDRLYGGEGNDTLTEYTDNGQDDIFDGGEGNDTFVIAGTPLEGFDYELNLEQESDQYGNAYVSIENVIAGTGNDTLTGSGVSNYLDGREGDDVIIGGSFTTEQVNAISAADRGTRDEIGDAIGHSDGSSLDPSSPGDADFLNGGDGDDLLLGGRGQDVVNGGEGDDVLYGNSGNDTLVGGEGNDTLYGGKGDDRIMDGDGNDTVLGDSGDDVVIAGSRGRDTYTGGSGNDTLDYSQSGAKSLKVDLSKGTVKGSGHNDKVNGFENFIGSNGNDKIKGSKNAESIDGGAGDDVIRGYKGADTLTGGDGADTFLWERKDVDAVDTITDFDMSSDTLDFRKLIKATKYDDASDVVRVEQTDEGSVVSVYSGSDYGWQKVALLQGVKTDVDQLFDDGLMLL